MKIAVALSFLLMGNLMLHEPATNKIDSTGSIGIGTTSPSSTLHVKQTGDISSGFIRGIRLEGLYNSYQFSAGVQGLDNTTFGRADDTGFKIN